MKLPGSRVLAILGAAALAAAVAGVALTSLVGKPASAQSTTPGYRVVGWNNLGMHCDDADFAVFSILPPYNVLVAQVVDPTGSLVTNPAGLTVTYQAVADATGSINRTSAGKTNFWDNVVGLFGVSLPVDAGLKGADMPGPSNTPKPMTFDPAYRWFIADGIPIVPYDDAGKKNPYPLMRVSVRDSSGTVLASSDVVLPVSDEMSCATCHGSGTSAAARPAAGWVYDQSPERDYRLNVLRVHDDRQLGNATFRAAAASLGYSSAGLYATVTVNGRAVLCANCHGSNALPGTGMTGIPQLTNAIHSVHAGVTDPTNGQTLDASTNRSACYRCHPGSTTRCLRGVMGSSVGTDGTMNIQCQNCHGSMSAVGASTRIGWLQEPTCQNCHTGTAVTNSGAIRFTSAFSSPGVLRTAASQTFATTPNVPQAPYSLYRFSAGHGGLQCEACHGSTHAEYASSHPNDNVESLALQGHVGTIAECGTCHNPVPSTTNGGPHGMHPVGQAWVSAHEHAAEAGTAACQSCHGTDLRGTVLSRSFANRTVSAFGTRSFWRGFQIGCYTCHNGPGDDHATSNAPAVVSNLTASTSAGVPVAVNLVASDANGNALTLRVVSQPAKGTVGLSGTTATYFPFAGTSGPDTFTYAAWDGSTDSNLGTVSVSVAGAACTLTCSASAPATGTAGQNLQFTGSATPSNCPGDPAYLWDFGDGTGTSSFQNPTHAYAAAGTYTWKMTASVGSVTCTRTGTVTIGGGACTLTCAATVPSTAVQGTAVSFTGSATPSGCSGTVSYSWSFGDGSAPATTANATHTYASTGTYSWTLTTSVSGVTCTRTGSITVTAPSTCVVSCSTTVPSSARRGSSVTFSATANLSNCSGSTLRYRWSFGDGSSSSSGVATHTYTRTGTYTWTLTVTYGSATCTRSGTIRIRNRD